MLLEFLSGTPRYPHSLSAPPSLPLGPLANMGEFAMDEMYVRIVNTCFSVSRCVTLPRYIHDYLSLLGGGTS